MLSRGDIISPEPRSMRKSPIDINVQSLYSTGMEAKTTRMVKINDSSDNSWYTIAVRSLDVEVFMQKYVDGCPHLTYEVLPDMVGGFITEALERENSESRMVACGPINR